VPYSQKGKSAIHLPIGESEDLCSLCPLTHRAFAYQFEGVMRRDPQKVDQAEDGGLKLEKEAGNPWRQDT
jgi:hypothetical protein